MFGLTEFQLFAATMVVGGTFAALIFAGRQYRLNRGPDLPGPYHDPYRGDAVESSALRAAREKFRDGGTIGFKEPDTQKRYDNRKVGKHPALSAPYTGPGRTRSIFLTPRQLERVNIQRRLDGRAPLNRAGFTNAVAHAWDQPVKQPDTSSDWLTYLILYECLLSDHESPRVGQNIGLTITPDAPYNGHGGEFAGAGASGNWTTPDASTAAVASAIADRQYTAAHDPDWSPGATGYVPETVRDPVPQWQDPAPAVGQGDGGYPQSSPSDPSSSGPGPSYSPAPDTPSYSAPDTSSSYSAPDTSSSYSAPDTSSNYSAPDVSSPSFDAGSN